MKAQEMLITPEKAEMLLKKNLKNRRISWKHVKRLSSVMESGKWENLNGDSIKISASGVLLDGQHRLLAVVTSGVSIAVLVVTEIQSERAFETLDRGKPRSINDTLINDGVKNTVKVGAAARRLLAWELTKDKRKFTLNSDIYKNLIQDDVVQYAREHDEEIQPILSEIKSSLVFSRCGAGSSLLASLIICNRVDDVCTMLFIDSLRTGAGLTEHSPIHHLREKLIFARHKSRGNRGKFWETEVMALTIKAWNKYRDSKDIKILRWSQEEPIKEKFPIPGGK